MVNQTYSMARHEQLDRRIRRELTGQIIPSVQEDISIMPNFFLEAKGPDGSLAVAGRQACYDGALGARGILSAKIGSFGHRFAVSVRLLIFGSRLASYSIAEVARECNVPVDGMPREHPLGNTPKLNTPLT
jgi:hypothetical protein